MNDDSKYVIKRSLPKTILWLCAGVFMTAGCVFMVVNFDDLSESDYRRPMSPFLGIPIGIFGVAFFGALTLFLGKAVFSNRPLLVVDENGICDHSSPISIGLIPWRDIESLRISTVSEYPGKKKIKIIQVRIKNEGEYMEKFSLLQKLSAIYNKDFSSYEMITINLMTATVSVDEAFPKIQALFKEYKRNMGNSVQTIDKSIQ